jgi:hypothetical protein
MRIFHARELVSRIDLRPSLMKAAATSSVMEGRDFAARIHSSRTFFSLRRSEKKIREQISTPAGQHQTCWGPRISTPVHKQRVNRGPRHSTPVHKRRVNWGPRYFTRVHRKQVNWGSRSFLCAQERRANQDLCFFPEEILRLSLCVGVHLERNCLNEEYEEHRN